MTTGTIKLVQGDTGPNLTLTLTDSSSGNPIDLTAMTSARMLYRAKGSTTLLSTPTLSVVAPATNGQLLLVPTSAMTTTAGYYEGEVELTLSGGQIVTGFRTLRFYVRAQF
jgi:hypothetical protein